MSNNDELGLAPLDDDELSLPMIEAKVEKIVASEVKPKPGQRLVPVVCAICHTRMYAVEDQIGQWKRCPDCDSLTEIKTVPEKAIFTTKETELEGSFNLSEAEVDSRDLHQLREEAKRQTRAAAVGIYDTILDIPLGPSPEDMNENTPMLERLFNTILTSSEEKEERRKIAEREKRIQEQADAIKHAAQLGALESFFKKPEPSASKSPSAQLKSVAPPPLPKSFSAPTPAPPQSTRIPFSFAPKKSALKPTLWSPLLHPRSRPRMLLLLIAGLLGNTFSEKAKVMIFSALADANYMFQKTDLVVLFWLGVSMFIIWLAMLFLFGMSLFLEISQGKNRVEHWIPFNLNFGCSYFLWMLLILLVAGVPGTWLLVTLAYFFPEIRSFMPSLLPALNILVFPIVFLCVIESETFLGPFPRKTLTSLLRLPRLWLRFYATTFFLVVVPLIVLFLWTYAGMGKRDLWESQTVMYVFSGMIWTACGFFVLLYFLRLGLLAWEIEQEYETAA